MMSEELARCINPQPGGPRERRKRGRPRKTWMEGVKAAMTTRNLEPDQWRNREEWILVSGRRQQLYKKPDR